VSVNTAAQIETAQRRIMDPTVIMDWQLSSYFGWGVYGVNLMLNWSRAQTGTLVTSHAVNESIVDLNPVEWALLAPAIERSRSLQAQLEPYRGNAVVLDLPVLHALGNSFTVSASGPDVRLAGKPSIGVTFFEFSDFSTERRERAKAFALIVAGSTWNRELLDAAGIPSALAFQGVDPTVFHPAPTAGWFDGRFAIFSGGKLEYRKGQDLVLKAFRAFSSRHPDAVLVTAWSSPWPGLAASLNGDPTLAPIGARTDGSLDVRGWAHANGIAADKVIDLGAVPNHALPRLYREMDVALFPNRCEGGTNLVAMECMACAVPVILSRNTGHLDLIAPDRCFSLDAQSTIAGADYAGWGESDIEEIVETLETVKRNAPHRRERGERAARFMNSMTWQDTARQLTGIITPYR
jgi:glycosyltransferase involved in cell wall biosynthesis